jgi:hypothetical protein
MSSNIRRCIADCELCERAKAKWCLAHGRFRGTTTDRPRSRYSSPSAGPREEKVSRRPPLRHPRALIIDHQGASPARTAGAARRSLDH